MFTGIVQASGRVTRFERDAIGARLEVEVDAACSLTGLRLGASVAVDGVCLTAVAIDGQRVAFDVIHETLARTTLASLAEDARVNIERSASIGDEVGGHLVSGHVACVAEITAVEDTLGDHVVRLQVPEAQLRYIFPKGFITLDGASLTVVDVNRDAHTFTVHLIPETLARTTFGWKRAGHRVNLEVDAQTVATVQTVEAILAARLPPAGS